MNIFWLAEAPGFPPDYRDGLPQDKSYQDIAGLGLQNEEGTVIMWIGIVLFLFLLTVVLVPSGRKRRKYNRNHISRGH
jgi:hypothetical protein